MLSDRLFVRCHPIQHTGARYTPEQKHDHLFSDASYGNLHLIPIGKTLFFNRFPRASIPNVRVMIGCVRVYACLKPFQLIKAVSAIAFTPTNLRTDPSSTTAGERFPYPCALALLTSGHLYQNAIISQKILRRIHE
jgi:hypothetical protein